MRTRDGRSAYLRVDYCRVTPVEKPLGLRGRITGTDGRKAFVLAEATG